MNTQELQRRADAIVKEDKATQAVSIMILVLEYAQSQERKMLRALERV